MGFPVRSMEGCGMTSGSTSCLTTLSTSRVTMDSTSDRFVGNASEFSCPRCDLPTCYSNTLKLSLWLE
jgi:hypothetical protein